jgi:DNA-binding transcriptional regulator PaaX
VVAGERSPGEWVLLLYRLPRQPSTPRSAVWRRLRRLGVAQLADGVVALPADARTREQLEWVADEVRAAAGTAVVWLARPTSLEHQRELADALSAVRAQEYLAVREQAQALGDASSLQERVRTARRLREELRRIRRRDFFPPAERDAAVAAVQALTTGPWRSEDPAGHGEDDGGAHAPEDLRQPGCDVAAAACEPAGSEAGR